MNGLALFAGIGGLELGMRLALGESFRTVCYVENDPAKVGYLVTRFGDGLDAAPIWDDVVTFDGRQWRGVVDIVTAGFPCRPYSSAARGRNVEPPIWHELVRIIGEVRPRFVFLENVPASLPTLRLVRDELRALDYCTLPPLEVSAAAVGAPFVGRRIFVLATANEEVESAVPIHDEVERQPYTQERWWDDIDRILLLDDGLPGSMAERRAFGDAVVPLVAAHAFTTLARNK